MFSIIGCAVARIITQLAHKLVNPLVMSLNMNFQTVFFFVLSITHAAAEGILVAVLKHMDLHLLLLNTAVGTVITLIGFDTVGEFMLLQFVI